MADDELEIDNSVLEDFSDTDIEDASSPKRPRLDASASRKFSGASTYKSKFKMSWKQKWSCVKPVQKNSHDTLLPFSTNGMLDQ